MRQLPSCAPCESCTMWVIISHAISAVWPCVHTLTELIIPAFAFPGQRIMYLIYLLSGAYCALFLHFCSRNILFSLSYVSGICCNVCSRHSFAVLKMQYYNADIVNIHEWMNYWFMCVCVHCRVVYVVSILAIFCCGNVRRIFPVNFICLGIVVWSPLFIFIC